MERGSSPTPAIWYKTTEAPEFVRQTGERSLRCDRDRGDEPSRRRPHAPRAGSPGASSAGRVPTESGWHRRAHATIELAHAGRPAWNDAGGLRAARRGRHRVTGAHTALGLRQSSICGLSAAPICGARVALEHALLLAGARVGRFRASLTLERGGLL